MPDLLAGDVNAILADPLQIAVIALGLYGFYFLYSGYCRLTELLESEREEIRKRLGNLTGGKRQMRAYQMINPKMNTRWRERWRSRPAARRRMYLGAAILTAAVIAWRFAR